MHISLKKVNYDQLDKLLNISGLQKTKNEYTTEEAHRKFMKLYPKIFIERKPILPGIPTKRTKGVHNCEFENINEFGEDSHNITLYLNKIKIPQAVHFGSPVYKEKMIILSKILKKIPVLRSPEEHETVYRTLKLIPDINSQLSDEELRELMTCIVREYWVKGSTVDGSQGFYAILRGSARPQTKYYKKLLGRNFVSSSFLLCPRNAAMISYSSSQTLLGVGSCFGTLIPLPTRLQLDALTIITEENCDILKIASTEYLRVKEELAKREKLAKEELIRGSPFYQNWPLVFIFQLTAHLKWKKFLKGHDLDPDIRMLLLQTVKPSFENITKDNLKFDYIKKKIEAEWKNTKDMAVNDVLLHSGIIPGFGKWVHEHVRFEKCEKEHGGGLNVAAYKKQQNM
ncbi:cyclic nucleotide-binding domain-containing protein 1 isoform X3 [Paroedura picta]|uniref:cyclic nucleotide-binding domain-containing protein 1 isoform X3 n=1 Tax=Paroedura picta TaxID=143630 RepID=UPI004057A2ED